MAQFGGDAHEPCGFEDLLEVEGLGCADDIPDFVRVPALDTEADGGEVGGSVEKASVAFADDGGFFGELWGVRKKDAEGALAFARDAGLLEFVAQRSEGVVVEAFAKLFIELDIEQGVDALEVLEG